MRACPSRAAEGEGHEGRGCDRCNGTGYKGRLGVFEIMEVSESLRDLIIGNAPIKECANGDRGRHVDACAGAG
jgi:type II secretory ATPase GspE/PulE/Tfp pilus assembly ATPase PilB-like protein